MRRLTTEDDNNEDEDEQARYADMIPKMSKQEECSMAWSWMTLLIFAQPEVNIKY